MEVKLILPDTNVLIQALGGVDPYGSFIKKAVEENQLVLSVVVVAEFLVGSTDEEERLFNSFLSQFKVLPVDLAVAQLAAFYRKKYLHLKKKLMLPDCFIAATCKIYNLILATDNKRDYPVDEIEIIDRF